MPVDEKCGADICHEPFPGKTASRTRPSERLDEGERRQVEAEGASELETQLSKRASPRGGLRGFRSASTGAAVAFPMDGASFNRGAVSSLQARSRLF
jgi:hypothetical protein